MHQARPVQTLPPAGHFTFVYNFAWFCSIARRPSKELGPVSEYPHDVTAAILVFQNNETAPILLFQTNPVGDGLFSFVKKFFCSHKFAWMLATWVNTLYTKNVKFERDLLTTNEEYRYAKSPNFTDVCMVRANLCPTTQLSEKYHFARF